MNDLASRHFHDEPRGPVQTKIDDDGSIGTERIKGARRGKDGHAHGKVVVIVPTTDGAALRLPGGITGHVHRVEGTKVHINLVLDLEHTE